jgi:hypothetical protein
VFQVGDNKRETSAMSVSRGTALVFLLLDATEEVLLRLGSNGMVLSIDSSAVATLEDSPPIDEILLSSSDDEKLSLSDDDIICEKFSSEVE